MRFTAKPRTGPECTCANSAGLLATPPSNLVVSQKATEPSSSAGTNHASFFVGSPAQAVESTEGRDGYYRMRKLFWQYCRQYIPAPLYYANLAASQARFYFAPGAAQDHKSFRQVSFQLARSIVEVQFAEIL